MIVRYVFIVLCARLAVILNKIVGEAYILKADTGSSLVHCGEVTLARSFMRLREVLRSKDS